MERTKLLNLVKEEKTRSAWRKGVKGYAIEFLENLNTVEDLTLENLKETFLNGADSFFELSSSGNYEIYDSDIAERLCSPSKLKKTRNGERNPNRYETWLDVQTRALRQAYFMIGTILRNN